nr:hypothetical protein CFP56_42016 [Quercus suber]
MTVYVAVVADYIQTHYLKTPKCTSALSGKSYMQETLEGHPKTCYNMFRMAKLVFLHLCNELIRLHLLEEDTGIVSVQESIGVLLYILGHNADMKVTGNRFQHSLETIQRRFHQALWAIHSLGCLIRMQLSSHIIFVEIQSITHGLRPGVDAGGYEDKGVENLRCNLSTFLSQDATMKAGLPVQIATVTVLLGLLPLDFETLVQCNVKLQETATQSVLVDYIWKWFSLLSKEQQELLVSLLQTAGAKKKEL